MMMTDAPPSARRFFQVIVLAVTVLGLVYMIWAVLNATGAGFFYSLDDPYIHLSLAENLLRGHYGINPGELASPSSSILYPFLMAAGLALGLGTYAPLVANLAAMLAASWIMAGLIFDAFHAEGAGRVNWFALVPLPVALLAMNALAIPIMGMEHSLHILACVMVVAGVARMQREGAGPDALLVAGIVLCPLLRFEGVALAGAALLAVGFMGHWARAFVIGGVIAALLALYVMAMNALGLPSLPSSVMSKSQTSASVAGGAGASLIESLSGTIAESMARPSARFVAIGLLLILASLIPRRTRAMWPVAISAAMAVLAHLIAGGWGGGLMRYEAYLIALELAALLVVWRPVLSVVQSPFAAPLLVAVALAPVAKFFWPVTGVTPDVARWIHSQQYQMHRFVTEYFPEIVAVNDLGWVSFRNETYVLDLWGLGSEEARQWIAEEGHQPGWIADIAARREAVFAMVYDVWMEGAVPPEWCRLGELQTPRMFGTSEVAIYLIDPTREGDLRAALERFAPTLPDYSAIETYPCD